MLIRDPTTNGTAVLRIGWAAYGADVPARTAPALAVTIILGAVSFCCLGYALASVIRDQDAAQPIPQAVMLPLYFISGVFVAASTLPHWLLDVAGVFPVRAAFPATLAITLADAQFTGIEGCRQTVEEQPPEHGRKHLRTKELGLAGHPTLAIGRDAASGNEAVRMWMVAPTPTIP